MVPPGTNPPPPVASPSVEKGSAGAHVSPARSSSRGRPSGPREDDRAGEVRASSLPFPVEGGAAAAGVSAPGGVTVSSFLFFAPGVGLIARWRSVKVKQQKQERNKARALTGPPQCIPPSSCKA